MGDYKPKFKADPTKAEEGDPYKVVLDAIKAGKRGDDLFPHFEQFEKDGGTVTFEPDNVERTAYHFYDDGNDQPGSKSGRVAMYELNHGGSFTRLLVCVEDGFVLRPAKKLK